MFSFKLKGRSPSINKSSGMNRNSVDSSMTSTTNSSLSSNASGMWSSQTLVGPPPKRSKSSKPTLPDYAEMLEDDNMAWGPPKSRRR